MHPFARHRCASLMFLLMIVQAVMPGAQQGSWADGAVGDNYIPDFYQQPGSDGPRSYASGPDGTETIDPFSGMLQLNYTDLVVPGNGGLDISINRNYQNIQGTPGVVGTAFFAGARQTGNNWSVHMGRIMIIDQITGGAGACPVSNVTSARNPVLELPTGSKQVLFTADPGAGYDFLSELYWKADCIATGGLKVTSPDGTIYTFDNYKPFRFNFGTGGVVTNQPIPETHAWHVTRVEDRNGNSLTISYKSDTPTDTRAAIDTITSSDGRVVIFGYTTVSDARLLTSIEANGQSWTYGYTELPNQGLPRVFLTSVEGPEGYEWTYDYYGLDTGNPDSNAAFSLQKVTGPFGGVTEYTFNSSMSPSIQASLSILSRSRPRRHLAQA